MFPVTKLIQTIKLRFYTLFKVPMINYCRPVVVEITDDRSHVVIPLRYRTKNHVNSMYFGSLSVGADLCVGLLGMHHIGQSGGGLVLIFKDFKVSFIKKALSHVHFICAEGEAVKALIAKVVKTGHRQNATVHGFATTPTVSGDEHIAKFDLTLSVGLKK